MSGRIKVYHFRKFDITGGVFRNSNRPATLETIRRIRAEPFMSTECEVDAADLDGDGFLKTVEALAQE